MANKTIAKVDQCIEKIEAELDAEHNQLTAEDQFTDAQTSVATSLVALYKALDGGWLPKPPAGKVAAIR
jgi:hypothetical protein